MAADVAVPTPPFFGTRVVKGVPLADYAAMLDERATFLGQWGLRGARGGNGPSYEELVETEGRPRLRYWLDRLIADQVLEAAVVYGYFPAYSEGNDLVVLDENGARGAGPVLVPPAAPGAAAVPGRLLQAPRATGCDVVALQLVTVGQPISEYAAKLFARNEYRDYLEVHGLSVQLTEALAEYWHRRIRAELTLPDGRPVGRRRPDGPGRHPAQRLPGLPVRVRLPGLPGPGGPGEDRGPARRRSGSGWSCPRSSSSMPEQATDAIVVHHPEAELLQRQVTPSPCLSCANTVPAPC